MRAEALRYKALRDEKDLYKAELERIEPDLKAAEAALIDKMLEQGITSTRIEGVGMLTASNKLVAKISDKEKFFAWLQDTEREGYIKHEVNYMTLQALANELDEAELKTAHDAGMDYEEKTVLSLRK